MVQLLRISVSSVRWTSTLHQLPDQFGIRRRELERRQLLARNPPDLLAKERRRLTDEIAFEEMQLQRAARVRVGDRQNLVPDTHLAPEFFLYLARQAESAGLVSFAFAARKLPIACEVSVLQPAGDEKELPPLDDRGGHDDAGSIGHASGRGWNG